ncbi:MAG: hypothetical protein JWO03_418 [Bacteroidetes bacterium]|nr:hypothetical protein [Bacteroidota bacterium]
MSACAISSHGQDTLKYHYAILNLDRVHEYANVEYNNGYNEDLWKKLRLSLKQSRHEIIFKCFEYLNDNRYEYAGGEFFTSSMAPEGTTEYIFKRKRRD